MEIALPVRSSGYGEATISNAEGPGKGRGNLRRVKLTDRIVNVLAAFLNACGGRAVFDGSDEIRQTTAISPSDLLF